MSKDPHAKSDAIYAKGFREGFERGAYEEMTQEDKEWAPWNGRDPFFCHSMLGLLAVKKGILRQVPHDIHSNAYITELGQLWIIDDAVPLGNPRRK